MSENPSNDGTGHERDPCRDEDLCLDLLHNLLPSEEKEAIFARMANDAELESTFRRLVAERERLRATRRLKVRHSGELVLEKTGTGAAISSPPAAAGIWVAIRTWWRVAPRPRGWQVSWAVGVATAAVVALVFLAPRMRSPGALSLLHPLPTYQDDLRLRSEVVDEDDTKFVAGLRAYSKGDYRHATTLLQQVHSNGPLETVRRLYLGSALAQRAQWHQAVTILESEATSALPDPWGSEARWTLAIALQETGQQTQADSLLQVLAGEPGKVGERAREYLRLRSGPAP